MGVEAGAGGMQGNPAKGSQAVQGSARRDGECLAGQRRAIGWEGKMAA